jgi:LacI family transcriptional regulator
VNNGIEHVANENGYNVIICLSDESFDKEVLNMEMLAKGSIDGFIMSLSKETQFKGDFKHITEVINKECLNWRTSYKICLSRQRYLCYCNPWS